MQCAVHSRAQEGCRAGKTQAETEHSKGMSGHSPDVLRYAAPLIRAAQEADELFGLQVGREAPADHVAANQLPPERGGGYAELARIDYRMAMAIPAQLDYVRAAATLRFPSPRMRR